METLITFAIALVVTLFFVRKYVKGLAPAAAPASPAGATTACPRCGGAVPEGTAFCGKCGAPLELWKVHRSSVAVAPADGEKGKPRPVINASLCIGCGTCVDVCPEQGTLALVSGKAILASPEKCTGHAKCVEVCPTSAIGLAFGNVLQTLKVPLVDENFETNIPGVFIVGELGGMGLIKTAINEGRLVIDYIFRRQHPLQAAPAGDAQTIDFDAEAPSAGGDSEATPEDPVDVIILGAGPAGLSAALTAKQHGMSYRAFDQGEVASTIKQYPRHKFLMAEPVSMPLYGNLYIADGTKESLVSVWENIIANTGVEVRTEERGLSVARKGDVLEATTSKGVYYGKTVVLAIGKRGTPRRLGAPGEDMSKVAYRLIEAETYENNDILVVGGGDSAIEAALALSRSKRNRVTLSYRKDTFSRARERNQKFLADAEVAGAINVLRKSQVRKISKESVELECPDGKQTLPNEFVFVMIGGESPEGFLRQVGIEIVEKSVAA